MSVSPIEVKQCFVLSNRGKECADLAQSQFRDCINAMKNSVVQLSESQLNLELPSEGQRSRVVDYNQRNWVHDVISIRETQVFVGAGELPYHLTTGSLSQVASKVAPNLASIPTCRGKSAIPGITSVAPIVTSERLLSVIALPTNDPYRAQVAGIRWHLDDGSMRAIALAIAGQQTLNAYIGTHPTRSSG